jgi:protein tyrosine/serine phosphatase
LKLHSTKLNLLILTASLILQGCAAVNGNFKTVDPGHLYRSGQLTGDLLERRIQMHDIKSVISMRATAPDEFWYQNEIRVCQENDIQHIDMDWSKEKIPTPESLNTLLTALNEFPKPILIHCQGGVHRSAIASAIYQLNKGESKQTAKKEIGLLFMHAPIGDFLNLYPDDTKNFANWVINEYPSLYIEYQKH